MKFVFVAQEALQEPVRLQEHLSPNRFDVDARQDRDSSAGYKGAEQCQDSPFAADRPQPPCSAEQVDSYSSAPTCL